VTAEFQPYVFQLLSMLLEMRPPGVPESYMQLFPFLLAPPLWESGANTTPLVRLLRAYLACGSDSIFLAEEQFQGLLGVFQKLIATKVWPEGKGMERGAGRVKEDIEGIGRSAGWGVWAY
jgi:exportin-2 (importin alpha re-exporter)